MWLSTAILPWLFYYAMADCPADELPEPQLYADGKFYYPNGTPRCVSEGLTMNISWSTTFETANLYLIDGKRFNNPAGIILNTASTWHEWTVTSDVTNHSTPFVFRIVNAQGSSGTQMSGGFLSGRFYISFKEDPPTSTTTSMTTTTTASSTQSGTGSPTQSNIPPATAISSSAHTEQSSPKGAAGPNNIVALGVGIGLGVPFCLAVGAAVFFARRRNKQTPLPPPAPDYNETYWKAELEQNTAAQTQELQGDSEWDAKHWANQNPVRYELG